MFGWWKSKPKASSVERLLRSVAVAVGGTEAFSFLVSRSGEGCEISFAAHLRGNETGVASLKEMEEAETAAREILERRFRDPVQNGFAEEVAPDAQGDGPQFFIAYLCKHAVAELGFAVLCRRKGMAAAEEVIAALREPFDIMRRNEEAAA